MRPSFFLAAKAPAIKVYLTHGPQVWYNGVGIIIYIYIYMILTLEPHRGALVIISLALG